MVLHLIVIGAPCVCGIFPYMFHILSTIIWTFDLLFVGMSLFPSMQISIMLLQTLQPSLDPIDFSGMNQALVPSVFPSDRRCLSSILRV